MSLEAFFSVDTIDASDVADLGGFVPVVFDIECPGLGFGDFVPGRAAPSGRLGRMLRTRGFAAS